MVQTTEAAIFATESSGSKMYYIHKDHLGSYQTITNENGEVATLDGLEQVYNFDPWGRKRNPETWAYESTGSDFPFTRGFTAHESIKEFGLINMNGRMYDPLLGMFLSPDPHVTFPDRPQNHNRYNYALGNPLKFTDPTGYDSSDPNEYDSDELASYYESITGYDEYGNAVDLSGGDLGNNNSSSSSYDMYGRPRFDPFSGLYIAPYARDGGAIAEGYTKLSGHWKNSYRLYLDGYNYRIENEGKYETYTLRFKREYLGKEWVWDEASNGGDESDRSKIIGGGVSIDVTGALMVAGTLEVGIYEIKGSRYFFLSAGIGSGLEVSGGLNGFIIKGHPDAKPNVLQGEGFGADLNIPMTPFSIAWDMPVYWDPKGPDPLSDYDIYKAGVGLGLGVSVTKTQTGVWRIPKLPILMPMWPFGY